MAANAQQQLLDAARQGDPAALGELLTQFRPYVRVLVRSAWNQCVSARLDDSDIIQDTMTAAHPAFATFRGTTVAEFAGWLRTVALRNLGHTLRTHLDADKRTLGREQSQPDFDSVVAAAESEPETVARRHEQAARVAAALERLPADMRQVVYGRFFDQQTYAELATTMQRSEGALRVLYTRALRRLAEDLHDEHSA